MLSVSVRIGLLTALLAITPVGAATILVFGDSLSAGYGLQQGQGWVTLLQRDLAARHRVINASQSGETTDGGLTRLPQALRQHKPDIVVLELGGNDGLRGLPTTRIASNLQKMVTLSRQAHAKVLLVGMALPPNYGPQYTAEFRAVYDTLARRNRLAYVPLLVAGFEKNLNQFQPDGIHPKAERQAARKKRLAGPSTPPETNADMAKDANKK